MAQRGRRRGYFMRKQLAQVAEHFHFEEVLLVSCFLYDFEGDGLQIRWNGDFNTSREPVTCLGGLAV
jgi:hypothetical protein